MRIPLVASALLLLTTTAALPITTAPPEEVRALFDIDSASPLELRVDEPSAEDLGGVRRVTVRYRSPAGGDVLGDLFEPEGDGLFAGLLVMHGFPGRRENVRERAAELARRGAVTLAIDAPFARRDGPPLHWDERDRDEQIQLIRDLRRGIDLLTARDDVDAGRLGFYGVSYGAAMGGLLAGVEQRLVTYVLMVGDGGLVAHFTGPEDAGQALDRLTEKQREAWLAAMRPIEPLGFIGQASPASIFFQNGRHDRAVPPADARAFQEAGSEPKTVKWYDEGHSLNAQARADAVNWLVETLELEP